MARVVILDRAEEECLARTLEAALQVRSAHQLFLWAQGQLQSLLPHGIMVCILFAETGEARHVECLHGTMPDTRLIRRLCDKQDGLAVRLALHCRAGGVMPCVVDAADREAGDPVALFHAEIMQCGMHGGLAHGTERLLGADTFFALFSMPSAPRARQAFLLDLLLPSLHLAFLRSLARDKTVAANAGLAGASPLTAREIQILHWVAQGKSNIEIGLILELSALTVKNRIQNVYRKLDVRNRAQAVMRCHELRLFDKASE